MILKVNGATKKSIVCRIEMDACLIFEAQVSVSSWIRCGPYGTHRHGASGNVRRFLFEFLEGDRFNGC